MRGSRRDTQGHIVPFASLSFDTGFKGIYSLEMQVYSHAPTCLMTKVLFSEPSTGL